MTSILEASGVAAPEAAASHYQPVGEASKGVTAKECTVLFSQVHNALALGVVAAAVEGFASAGAFMGGAFHHGSAALRAKDGDFIGGRLPGGARVRVHPLSLEIADCDFKSYFLS